MTRLVATLLKANISIVDSLAAVARQSDNPRLSRVLNEVRRAVTEGKSLAGAMGEHPWVFPDLYINMVRAGESSGTLDQVFLRLADFTESQARLRSRIMGAMTYPVIMLFLGTGVVSLLMAFVVPKLTVMFSEMGGKLPAITRGLIAVSEFVQNWWHVSLGCLVLAAWLFARYRKTDTGRKHLDRLLLRLPLFGGLMRLVGVARFSRTLGTLLHSGVPIITALEIVKHVIGNSVLSDAVEAARLSVKEGEALGPPLLRSGQFPAMVVHMITVGEQSGQLEEMLDNVAGAYEMQVDGKINVLTALLEPLMIVGMGVVVALIVFAILTPMLQMNELLKG
jgi:general secretion pathway protein F